MRPLKVISLLFVTISIMLMIIYTIAYFMLRAGSLNTTNGFFFAWQYSGNVVIFQAMSFLLLLIYLVKTKTAKMGWLLAVITISYFLFGWFMNETLGLFNPF